VALSRVRPLTRQFACPLDFSQPSLLPIVRVS